MARYKIKWKGESDNKNLGMKIEAKNCKCIESDVKNYGILYVNGVKTTVPICAKCNMVSLRVEKMENEF